MDWYYSKNATQLGPVPDAELRAKLGSGEILATDMVWREGMQNWVPVSSLPELRPPTPSVVTPGHPGNASVFPYAPPMAAGTQYAGQQTSGLAIASLVCGIFGLFCTFLPGIAAVICGHLALKEISKSNSQVGGRGMAIAGLVLGYISIAMLALWLVTMVVGVSTGAFR